MIYKKYKSTMLNKNQLAQKITKRNMHRTTHIYQRTNIIINNINILIPRPSLALYTPRSVNSIFPIIRNNVLIQNTFRHHPISTNHFIQNEIIENTLTTIVALIKEEKQIAQKDSLKITIYKSFNGKEYTTFITKNTNIKDIPKDVLIEELLKRELIKKDDGKTISSITLEDGSIHVLGASEYKLTPLGQAYVETLHAVEQKAIVSDISETMLNLEHFSLNNLMIILPPSKSENTFIEHGIHKHLIIIMDHKGDYYATGYLTSKISEMLLSNQQFKHFQTNTEIVNHNKKQYVVFFEQLQKLPAEQCILVQKSTPYLENLDLKTQKSLVAKIQLLSKQSIKDFNNEGVTMQNVLDICIKYDANAKQEKPKHPLTKNQQKKNQENKEKQQLKQKTKNNDNIEKD